MSNNWGLIPNKLKTIGAIMILVLKIICYIYYDDEWGAETERKTLKLLRNIKIKLLNHLRR